jgi:predicted nucleic acid-binding protein
LRPRSRTTPTIVIEPARGLRGEALAAPDLVDLEVTSVLRGRLVGGHISRRRAELAPADLVALPLDRSPSLRLVPRCWELRDTVTVYQAAYVALVEALGVPVLTADARLVRATGLHSPSRFCASRSACRC